MNDEAAHLVGQVLPQVNMRQWVLSFPYKLRFQMAHNARLTSQILPIFIVNKNDYKNWRSYSERHKIIQIFFDSMPILNNFTQINLKNSNLNSVQLHTLCSPFPIYIYISRLQVEGHSIRFQIGLNRESHYRRPSLGKFAPLSKSK